MTTPNQIAPHAGAVDRPEPGLRRVLAPNPSPMTFLGTNTYILGQGEVAVIDPGPQDAAHMAAIIEALEPGERISHIVCTHSHLDHSALAPELSEVTGAPIVAYGDSTAGRREDLVGLADLGGGEGVHLGFAPHEILADAAWLHGKDWSLQAIWTPGHMGNHICLAWGDRVFSGDHVMGWATSMVSPPDGDLGAFMDSLRKLEPRRDRVFYPAHGDPIDAPQDRVRGLLAHRKGREAEIRAALTSGPATAPQLAKAIYTDIPPALIGAATRNVLAHLIDLTDRKLTEAETGHGLTTEYALR